MTNKMTTWLSAFAVSLMLFAPAALAQDAPVPNRGDTAWMFVATLLVIMMAIPGLALFYGGLVRSKNMVSVLLQVLMIFSLGFLKKSQKTINIAALEAHQMQQAAALHGQPANHAALPPQTAQSYTAPQGGWRTPDTGEFSVPGSVTDTTTKLLNKDE